MEEKYGLVTGVECRYVKTDPEIIEAIATRIGKDQAWVKRMMRYNVFTINQYACLSGLGISTILNKTRPLNRNGELVTDLNFCYPFSDCKDSGPKFILRDSKSEKYLKA